MPTQYSVAGNVATIRLDNSPVNGLGHSTRAGILADLRRALESPEVDAVVLTGGGDFFSAGADITEFGTPNAAAEPSLQTVIDAFDAADKPVIAAIDGICFGGGLELALGAHFRVATADSRIALPEVKLGLVPGAGGTQRLPRVVDLETAIDMIAHGNPRTARSLADLPGQRLFDLVVDDDAVGAASQFAQRVTGVQHLPRIRDLAAPDNGAVTDAARKQLHQRSRGSLAPLAALDLIAKATTLPFAEGLDTERHTFAALVAGEQSAALRHAFFAERAARTIPGLPRGIRSRAVETVGVIGAGTMGGGIAMNFLDAGIPVTLVETKSESLDRGIQAIRRNYQVQVDKGKLDAAALQQRMDLLTPTLDYVDIADCDLVIEAVFEDMDVKRDVFAALGATAKRGAILASNTSTLDIDAIAAITSRPGDVVGMHFFSPANVMTLLEVVRGKETADDVLVTAMETGRRVGKIGVVSGVCDGFIGNRMLARYQAAAKVVLNAGATPAQIDNAIEGFGLAMGPFRMADLAGNDIGWAIRKRRYAEQPESPRDAISDALCELGRFGQKTGGGWYDYEAGSRVALPSPTVDALLASFRASRDAALQTFEPEEIVQRLIFALVDEGARILEEGIASRASDIDVVYMSGYGFPRHRGGPMFYADTVGLGIVLTALRRFAPPGWEPASLLVRLAREGGTFSRL
ncbi:3-hydroxyacyl-CoA dehydrogenase NAD-binding domain-containing protein [Rhodococcus sp. NCIMB 12038]|uniref:3-hydroxyacyl-CoA dehydrogenase NAD-binding domain-containing protein n=1 Tax=Rhodococcus sp. NCIMB 12038 TaxID=933800 RepID=UPI000B3D1CA1|nr:3-hydroxyacyl-CoA dehydrogenase NAD-binding domain-containing protein [Rhodococcus sp. NCIMB 12038]OUS93643.1 3-hydroxyacyl-CoA dehydrogenase [Rhodococcus sp. NCIMB 12038]